MTACGGSGCWCVHALLRRRFIDSRGVQLGAQGGGGVPIESGVLSFEFRDVSMLLLFRLIEVLLRRLVLCMNVILM